MPTFKTRTAPSPGHYVSAQVLEEACDTFTDEVLVILELE